MASVSPQIKGSVNLILDYKSGKLSLEETTTKLGQLSGLSKECSEAFLKNMRRDNVVSFPGSNKK